MNMKKLLIVICILANQFINSSKAQAPQSFNYQAVARDGTGAALSNQAVSFRVSLLQGTATGTNVYSETHAVTTNQFGLVNFAIGSGTLVSGSFTTINWATGPYFVQVEIDATGGSTYVVMNTTQLLSVPYAMYAGNGSTTGQNVGDMMYWNGTSWTNLTVGVQGQVLTMCGGIPTWGGCLPQLTTNAATNITQTSATITGSITSTGGLTITASGICYSITQNPTISNSIVANLNATLQNLSAGVTYYARAYATNSIGTAYGNQISFTTLNTAVPILHLDSTSFISAISAQFSYYIISNGGSSITNQGVCVSTAPNPTTSNIVSVWYDSIGGLQPNTLYYARAYATNSTGTGYSNQITFTTTNLPSFSLNGFTVYIQPAPATYAEWGPTTTTTGATSSSNGLVNTTTIVNSLGTYNSGNYAAKVCDDLILYGFSDWYLPSKDEIQLALSNQGAFWDAFYGYWSSTEANISTAYYDGYWVGTPTTATKTVVKTIGCVRHQ